MKKIWFGLLILILAISAGVALDYLTTDINRAVPQDSEVLFSYKKNESIDKLMHSNIDIVKKLSLKYVNEKQFNQLKEIVSNMNELFFVSNIGTVDKVSTFENIKSVIGLDLGRHSIRFRLWMMSNLIRKDGLYKLNDELKQQMGLEDIDIYFKNYKRYILCSLSKDYLQNYYNEIVTNRNLNSTAMGKKISENRAERPFMLVANLEKIIERLPIDTKALNFADELKILSTEMNIDSEYLTIKSDVEGSGFLFDTFVPKTPENRMLTEYIDKDSIYINMENLTIIARMVFNILKDVQGLDYPLIIRMLTRIDIYELIESLNGELLFRLKGDSYYGVAKTDSPDRFRTLFNALGISQRSGVYIVGKNKIFIIEDKIYLNKIIEKSTNKIVLDGETIYAKLALNNVIKNLNRENLFTELSLRSVDNKIEILMKLKLEDVIDLIYAVNF